MGPEGQRLPVSLRASDASLLTSVLPGPERCRNPQVTLRCETGFVTPCLT